MHWFLWSIARAVPPAALHDLPIDPPLFEHVQARGDSTITAQLNFELDLEADTTVPVLMDTLEVSYDGGPPVVFSAPWLWTHVDDGDRTGFGPLRDATRAFDIPDSGSEYHTDTAWDGGRQVAATNVRATVLPPQGGPPVTNERMALTVYEEHDSPDEWTVGTAFDASWESRATTVLPVGDDHYILAGGQRAYGGRWTFAVAKLDEKGDPVATFSFPDGETTTPFATCDAVIEDVEIDRTTIAVVGGTTYTGRLIAAGTATCDDGTKRLAVAIYGFDGTLLYSTTRIFAEGPVEVGGTAFDASTNKVYAVGQIAGEHPWVARLSSNATLDFGYGGGDGYTWRDLPLHTDAKAYDGLVDAAGKVLLGGEGKRGANYEFVALRFDTPSGMIDGALNGGYVTAAFSGGASYGRDIEMCDGGSFAVVGYQGGVAGTSAAFASWSSLGVIRTAFDADGKNTVSMTGGVSGLASATREVDDHLMLTAVGAAGSRAGTVEVSCDDGLPNHGGLITPGTRKVVLWPDTGYVPEGSTEPLTLWDWDDLPTGVQATLKFRSWPKKLALSEPLVMDIDLAPHWDTEEHPPGEVPDDHYWRVTQSHDVEDNHRRTSGYDSTSDRFVYDDRFAYDMSVVRWTGSEYDSTWDEGDDQWCDDDDDTLCNPNLGDCGGAPECNPNQNSLAYGVSIHPIAEGDIIHCRDGVLENSEPGEKDGEARCVGGVGPDGEDCIYSYMGNGYRILHGDGTVSVYSHLQRGLDDTLCPHDANGLWDGPVTPYHVTTGTVLGKLGNSGNSTGPHIHVNRGEPIDPTDPAESALDGFPLYFDEYVSVDYGEDPYDHPSDGISTGHIGSTVLVRDVPLHGDCEPVVPLSPLWSDDQAAEEHHPDGNFDIGYYCPNVDELGEEEERVCVLDGGVGPGAHCADCEVQALKPDGCTCNSSEQCNSNSCEGMVGEDGPGKCYPPEQVPWWQCPNDCESLYASGAWCYNDYQPGFAKCFEFFSSPLEADDCFENGGVGSLGVWESECVQECDATSEWLVPCGSMEPNVFYPSTYTCATTICVPPWVDYP